MQHIFAIINRKNMFDTLKGASFSPVCMKLSPYGMPMLSQKGMVCLFKHEKRLFYPVEVEQPNAKYTTFLQAIILFSTRYRKPGAKAPGFLMEFFCEGANPVS